MEIGQLEDYFAQYIKDKRPNVPECCPYLSAYPNEKGSPARDIRDKMRHLIPID